MCFSVACTGDPAEEFVPQVTYNNLFAEQTTTTTATQPKPTKTSKKNKQSKTKVVKKSKSNKNKKKVNVVVKDKATLKTKITKVVATVIETETTTKIETQETITTTLAPLLDTDICYITANGEKYHRQGCRYLKRSCIEIIVGEAKEKNYTPCKICKP